MEISMEIPQNTEKELPNDHGIRPGEMLSQHTAETTVQSCL
jgi:hypothetical protein